MKPKGEACPHGGGGNIIVHKTGFCHVPVKRVGSRLLPHQNGGGKKGGCFSHGIPSCPLGEGGGLWGGGPHHCHLFK